MTGPDDDPRSDAYRCAADVANAIVGVCTEAATHVERTALGSDPATRSYLADVNRVVEQIAYAAADLLQMKERPSVGSAMDFAIARVGREAMAALDAADATDDPDERDRLVAHAQQITQQIDGWERLYNKPTEPDWLDPDAVIAACSTAAGVGAVLARLNAAIKDGTLGTALLGLDGPDAEALARIVARARG